MHLNDKRGWVVGQSLGPILAVYNPYRKLSASLSTCQLLLAETQMANVSLAIYDSYTGFGQLDGMQITGTAELVEPWTDEYLELLAFKKIPAENLRKLPVTMNLIKVKPARIDFLCSEFKSLGFDPRQYLYLSNGDAE